MKGHRKLWGIVNCRISFSMDNGSRVTFSRDKWCGDDPLTVSFPSLFALATSKDRVADLWSHSNGRGVWTPRFSRNLNNWKIKIVEHFLAMLLIKVVVERGEDKMCWLRTKSGTFSVRPVYSSLEEGRLESFPVVWNA